MDTEKYCPKCDKVKPAKDFWKDKRAKTGLQSYCRQCMKNERPQLHMYKNRPK